MQEESVAPVLRQLLEWRGALQALENDQEFLQTWANVLDWLKTPEVAAVLADRIPAQGGDPYAQTLAPFQRRYLSLAETEVAGQLETERPKPSQARETLASSFGRDTYDRVREALELVDFDTCKRFVMVGCGPFPAAVLLIHDHTPVAEVVGLDCDPAAVRLASKLVRDYATPRVSIVASSGEAFDYRTFDTIYIANHVIGKPKVLARIAETAPRDVRVLLRDPCGLGGLLSESGLEHLPAEFSVRALGRNDNRFHSMHVLLGRRD